MDGWREGGREGGKEGEPRGTGGLLRPWLSRGGPCALHSQRTNGDSEEAVRREGVGRGREGHGRERGAATFREWGHGAGGREAEETGRGMEERRKCKGAREGGGRFEAVKGGGE